MKRMISNAFVALMIWSISACDIYTKTYSNYDRSIKFKEYKTFAMLPESNMEAKKDSFRNTAYDNDIIRNNAKNYIIHKLSKKGLRMETNEPDLLVQLVLLNEKKERIVRSAPVYPYYYYNRFYYPYYYPYFDYFTFYGWGCYDEYCGFSDRSYVQTYVKGTITINVFDRKLKKLVWTGSAEGNIYDPSYISESVHPAINRILRQFPLKEKPLNDY